jgi:hypothetical protein
MMEGEIPDPLRDALGEGPTLLSRPPRRARQSVVGRREVE